MKKMKKNKKQSVKNTLFRKVTQPIQFQRALEIGGFVLFVCDTVALCIPILSNRVAFEDIWFWLLSLFVVAIICLIWGDFIHRKIEKSLPGLKRDLLDQIAALFRFKYFPFTDSLDCGLKGMGHFNCITVHVVYHRILKKSPRFYLRVCLYDGSHRELCLHTSSEEDVKRLLESLYTQEIFYKIIAKLRT